MSPMASKKRLTCFFYQNGEAKVFSKEIDSSQINIEAETIQSIIEEQKINPYNLSFVIDDDKETYKAEYLDSLADFCSRKHLLKMETLIKKVSKEETAAENLVSWTRRCSIRTLSEETWIDKHASGTLRKNKAIGFSYRQQYLAERIAYEFGYGFEILPRSQITFGDPISEENCKPLTEAGWHIERYMALNVFNDRIEAKYIHASYRDNSSREGVGIILRETSASWIPAGHIVFSIIAEFNPHLKIWEKAINPF